jgi:CubicO group peptidase (beta-lactamase class C family)
MNPSGGVHCSILDYARYVRENLLGLKGQGKLLGQKEYETIHSVQITANISEMYMGSKEDREAMFGYGWGIVEREEGNLSAAAGSGGTFFAQIYIYPARNLAFVGFTNCGNGAQSLKETYQKATGLD